VLNPKRANLHGGEYEPLLNLDSKGAPVRLFRRAPNRQWLPRPNRIYELIAVDDHMRTMIHDGSSEQDLERYARTASPESVTMAQKVMAAKPRSKKCCASPAKTDGWFEYTALDSQGKERKGLIEGDTPKHVRQLLREKQLLPMEIQETRSAS